MSSTENPLFVNYNDGDGPDNIWGTADDGLRLQCSSPAIAAGTGVTPATDLLGLTRTTVLDIGAYEGEHANSAVSPLATVQTTVQLALTGTGMTNFSNCSNLVASLQSGSPYTVAGTVTSTVWLQVIQPAGHVRRHYEITPASNAATATSRVTLYFTQADFDAFNNQLPAPTSKLPMNSSDATGKQNLLVEKRAGVSSNGSGLPTSYTGAVTTINPNDADIIWNSTSSRWEVSFDVTGFSGFFVKTVSATLPLKLVDLTAKAMQQCNAIQWQTKDESNSSYFVIESSVDGNRFVTKGKLTAAGSGNNSYRYTDCEGMATANYYRLKMVDNDGTWQFSNIVKAEKERGIKSVNVYPTVTNHHVTIQVSERALVGTTVSLIDMSGKIQKQITLSDLQTRFYVNDLKKGMYILSFSIGDAEKIIIR